MHTFEYVASGAAHLRLAANALQEQPEVIEIINNYFSILNNKKNSKFSLLFNAFVEPDFGKRFIKFRPAINTVHADSGGLQIVTRGDEISNALKDKIYKTQAEYSDIAMCFDEIPVGVTGERSDRNDTSGRFFDKENLEHFAKQTGQNIKRQIEVFQEENSQAKAMIIAQGNCYDTYNFWVEYILKEIPSSYYEHIGGLAMGAAALGTGLLEDIERAVYATQLPFHMEKPYIHVLGVGAMRRLLPYLALVKGGYYPEGITISYDSTTHTMGVSNGLFYHEGRIKRFKDEFVHMYNDLDKKYSFRSKGIDEQLFRKLMNTDSTYYHFRDKDFIDKDKMILYYHNRVGFAVASIENFMDKVNDCLESEKKLMSAAHHYDMSAEVHCLLNIKTLDDFLRWKKAHGNSVRSKRVNEQPSSTLEAFL